MKRALLWAGAALLLIAPLALTLGPGIPPSLESIHEDSSWAATRERIFFFRDLPYRGMALLSIRLDGTGEEQVLAPPVAEISISGDGKKLAYARPLVDGTEAERGRPPAPGACGVLDLGTLQSALIAPRCWEAAWDPASRYLAYQPGNQNLYVYDTQTLRRRKVGEAEGEMSGARWSADGSRIYFEDRLSRARYEIEVENGRQRRLAEPASRRPCPGGWREERGHLHLGAAAPGALSGAASAAALSPSGTRLLRAREGSLILSAADGAGERVLLRNTTGFVPELGEMGLENPAWSADERFALGEYRGKIVVVEIAGGRAGVLTRGRRPAAWAARPSASRFVQTAVPHVGGARLLIQ